MTFAHIDINSELASFLRSPYRDIRLWDSTVQYDRPARTNQRTGQRGSVDTYQPHPVYIPHRSHRRTSSRSHVLSKRSQTDSLDNQGSIVTRRQGLCDSIQLGTSRDHESSQQTRESEQHLRYGPAFTIFPAGPSRSGGTPGRPDYQPHLKTACLTSSANSLASNAPSEHPTLTVEANLNSDVRRSTAVVDAPNPPQGERGELDRVERLLKLKIVLRRKAAISSSSVA